VNDAATRPIGVFDSGIGGLTVVHYLLQFLPAEDIIYFGDTARLPYGSHSPEIVRTYALEDAGFLVNKHVKTIIVACNTVSAVGIDAVRARFDVPVIGVIEPGASAAVRATRNKKIGVIGTLATITSNAYSNAIHAIDPAIEIFGTACPLFVPVAEEGWANHKAAELIAEEYLEKMGKSGVDTLVLGCTHYPLLHDVIQKIMGSGVTLVNPGEETALWTKNFIMSHNLSNPDHPDHSNHATTRHEFYLSDLSLKFSEIGERFLGMKLENVHKVEL